MTNRNKHKSWKLLLLASYANNLGWGIYSPLYALYVVKIGGSSFDVSLLWSIYALIAGTLMMLFGRLENNKNYNPINMLVIGYGLFIVVAFGLLFVKNIQQFYILQSTLALAMGIMTPAAKATYSRAQVRGKEAGSWGMFDGGNYILMSVAALSGGLLFKAGGFRAIFLTMIGVQTCAMLLAISNKRLYSLRAD